MSVYHLYFSLLRPKILLNNQKKLKLISKVKILLLKIQEFNKMTYLKIQICLKIKLVIFMIMELLEDYKPLI